MGNPVGYHDDRYRSCNFTNCIAICVQSYYTWEYPSGIFPMENPNRLTPDQTTNHAWLSIISETNI